MEATKVLSLKAIYSRSLKSAQNLASSTSLSDGDLYSEDSGDDHGYAGLLKRSDIEAVIIASVLESLASCP